MSAVNHPVAVRDLIAHFKKFLDSQPQGSAGAEGYLEPATQVTPMTLLVVAASGAWTRKPVANTAAGNKVAAALKIPVFDINLTGYPARMREWNEKSRGSK